MKIALKIIIVLVLIGAVYLIYRKYSKAAKVLDYTNKDYNEEYYAELKKCTGPSSIPISASKKAACEKQVAEMLASK